MARFLLIGLDGAEPTLLGPWMDAGYLPNLARLRARGGFRPLASTQPPATFPAWTTCVTGVNPGKHGLFDFTEFVPGQRAVRFVNSTYRKVPALWNVISAAGKRVGVLSVPGTYPPEPVNGFMVSGFDSPVASRLDASFVCPQDLYPEVRDWRFADLQESHIGPGWHRAALDALLRKLDDKERIACRLLAREPWDFFMVVFGESDTVSHHFWLFHDPQSPRHQAGFETAIRQVYERLDRVVGALVKAAGEDCVVAVLSDHGFGGAGTGVLHLNNWLAERGYLSFRPARESWAKRLALRFVPNAWRGPLFRRFSGWAARAESQSRLGRIDWEHTRAWSEELNYFPSIRIHDPAQTMSPAEYQALVTCLCAQLAVWPPIARAWPRDALYTGPWVERAPDILLDLALEDGYRPSCLRSPKHDPRPFRRLETHEYLGGKERGMNGTHRDTGVLVLSQPPAVGPDEVSLLDIAPTVLAVLQVPGPPMEGRSLLGNGPGTTNLETESAPEQPYTEAQARVLEDRLRGLGYLE